MTIPTIAELTGNTLLQLFKSGYTVLRNAVIGKQNKLIAGDNIIIDENTNRISAITGGEPVLEDYYTKEEVDEIAEGVAQDLEEQIDTKADTDDVYSKSTVDTMLSSKANASDVYSKSEVYTKAEVDAIDTGKADKSTTYTKTEVNSLLVNKANTSDVYTQSQVNTLLGNKADKSTTYTKSETYSKTEVDNLVTPKANSSDVYTKSETYNKTEVDNLISDLRYEEIICTSGGNVVTIPSTYDFSNGDVIFFQYKAYNSGQSAYVYRTDTFVYNSANTSEEISHYSESLSGRYTVTFNHTSKKLYVGETGSAVWAISNYLVYWLHKV